ncbi:MAG: VOC family protein [Bacteriovorax sp.]
MMKLEAIGIVAKNVSESIQFYRLLGLDFPELKDGEDHIEAQTPSGLRIMLDSEDLMKKLKPDWVRPVGQSMTLAFRCDSAKQVDETYKKIVASGHKGSTEPWDAFWGQRYASVLDPDGNAVDLFAPL